MSSDKIEEALRDAGFEGAKVEYRRYGEKPGYYYSTGVNNPFQYLARNKHSAMQRIGYLPHPNQVEKPVQYTPDPAPEKTSRVEETAPAELDDFGNPIISPF